MAGRGVFRVCTFISDWLRQSTNHHRLMNILRGRVLLATCAVITAIPSAGLAQEYFREFGTSRSSSGIGRLTPGSEVFTGNSPDGLSPIVPVNDFTKEE